MIKAGLTGGLSTGKSTVTAMFAELGAPAIDADRIVHRLLSGDEEVVARVTSEFGPGILGSNDGIDRSKLAAVVFSDEKRLTALTGILYPVVRREIAQWFREREEENKHPVAVAEVSMLIEGAALWMYDKIILVYATGEEQMKRSLVKGISMQDFQRRAGRQMPIEEKMKFADYVIDNTGDLEETRRQVIDTWEKLTTTRKSKR